mmetsp:Transcript_15241/g.42981  ORF Transcript_15241/g.42981 Transcript_15241/m.42981 type:complete len:217 (-) Transcript_15241:860-1510(-)
MQNLIHCQRWRVCLGNAWNLARSTVWSSSHPVVATENGPFLRASQQALAHHHHPWLMNTIAHAAQVDGPISVLVDDFLVSNLALPCANFACAQATPQHAVVLLDLSVCRNRCYVTSLHWMCWGAVHAEEGGAVSTFDDGDHFVCFHRRQCHRGSKEGECCLAPCPSISHFHLTGWRPPHHRCVAVDDVSRFLCCVSSSGAVCLWSFHHPRRNQWLG